MAERCTPFQRNQRARKPAPVPIIKVIERVRNVFPLSHTFDSLDGGDRRLIWTVEVPVNGVVLEPKVSCGACAGNVVLEAAHQGKAVATVALADSVQEIAQGPFKVSKGDRLDLFVSGSGTAKEVAISLVIREV